MGLFSHFSKDNANPPLHSSGIAGEGTSMGSASQRTFQDRKDIEHNRQHVGSYRNASVLHAYRQGVRRPATSSVLKRGTVVDSAANTHSQGIQYARSKNIQRTTRIDVVRIPNRGQASFYEPQKRGYDPYS